MKKRLLFLASVFSVLFAYPAKATETEDDGTVSTPIPNEVIIAETHQHTGLAGNSIKFTQKSLAEAATTDSIVSKSVKTSNAGELSALLGEDANAIDSLVVSGPINSDDIYALWSASLFGKLSVMNLEDADIENNALPDTAFWRPSVQVVPELGYIYVLRLRRIMLPKGLQAIGAKAFNYAVHLERADLPSSLRELGDYCFNNCIRLKAHQGFFPEGLEKIGNYSFLSDENLQEIAFPSTLREIGTGAFYMTYVSTITFSEGLEKIGSWAFRACREKEIVLPSTCLTLEGEGHFSNSYNLERIQLPEGLTEIPNDFAESSQLLKEVTIPSTVKSIGANAFGSCKSLVSFDLPEGLESIDSCAFQSCPISRLILPSTLTHLGKYSCESSVGIDEIYSPATTPPTCDFNSAKPEETPFGVAGKIMASSTKVYIPIGTTETYRNTHGWEYFNYYIETDDFPTTSGIDASMAPSPAGTDAAMYDLQGRKIQNPANGQIYIKAGKKHIGK